MKPKQDSLKAALQNLDPDTFQSIREAYYKAMEGLHGLAEALERADANQLPPAGPLLDEHFIAIEALGVMQRSDLGRLV